MPSKDYDWQVNIFKRGWPYKGDIDDPKYLKERSELFIEGGNGWWWFVPNKIHNPLSKRIPRIKKKTKSNE